MGMVIEQEPRGAVDAAEANGGSDHDEAGADLGEISGEDSTTERRSPAPAREEELLGTIDDAEGGDGRDHEEVERDSRESHEEDCPAEGRAAEATRTVTEAAWEVHEAEKRAAALSSAEKEEQADRLLAEHSYGDHYQRSLRTISRRRAREIPMSQLEASEYSGTQSLLESMADSLRLIDAEESGSLNEWSNYWDVVHAVRAERALTREERGALLGRLRGHSLRKTAGRLGVAHETVRTALATALEKYYAGKLLRLQAVSDAALCFHEDASRPTYRPPNCCGQSPLCVDNAGSKLCAECEHEVPEGTRDDELRPGDLNYCPLADSPERRWGGR
jgi:hypothetical protein